MSSRSRRKVVHDLDEEDFEIHFTDGHGRKRRFKLRPSLGIRELVTGDGKRYIVLLLEEVTEGG